MTWPHEYVVRTPQNAAMISRWRGISSRTAPTAGSTRRSASTTTRAERSTGRWTRRRGTQARQPVRRGPDLRGAARGWHAAEAVIGPSTAIHPLPSPHPTIGVEETLLSGANPARRVGENLQVGRQTLRKRTGSVLKLSSSVEVRCGSSTVHSAASFLLSTSHRSWNARRAAHPTSFRYPPFTEPPTAAPMKGMSTSARRFVMLMPSCFARLRNVTIALLCSSEIQPLAL